MGDVSIERNAIDFARKNKTEIVKKLTNLSKYPPDSRPVSVFMAGSPGAGKTEFSKGVLEEKEVTGGQNVLRIDADELRGLFKDYNGSNSFLFQAAVSIIVDALHDKALGNSQSFIFDGTFSQLDKARKNVQRSLKRERKVEIIYIYQKPELAWKFVKARERKEGRHIRAGDFIKHYFGARACVNTIKKEFEHEVQVDLVVKNLDNSPIKYRQNIDLIDNHVEESYSLETLTEDMLS